jgi:HAE1 family hydrophobic/amphiphilic exporter-1
MKLTELAVDRPVTTVMVSLIIIVISAVSLSRLPIDLMPDITYPAINVVVNYEGAGPEEIETLVTRPLEEAMGSVSDIEEIESVSEEDRARVQLRFAWGIDLDAATDDVRERLDRLRDMLPDEIDPPVLFKFDIDMMPIMFLGLGGKLDPVDLRYLAEHTLKYRLERVPGVASVDISGGFRREIQVNVIREKLVALTLAPETIVRAVRAENLDLPAGEVDEGDIDLLVRTRGQFTSVEQIGQIVVAVRNGVPVYLKDVAEIMDGFEEVRQIERINGQPGITMSITKRSGSNTVQVADAVYKEIAGIERDFPHLQIVPLFDSAEFIRDSIANVRTSALYGAILAVLILLIFLRNIRSTLIIATAIPISMMASFSLIYFGGLTLNIISFGGLALGIGMLVDNSIVVLENIFRHREEDVPAREAALKGSTEVTAAIIASTLTTLVVFLPLVFLSGAQSVLFGELSYVVAFSLTCSLLVALTLVPMLCRTVLKMERLNPDGNETLLHKIYRASESGFSRADEVYREMLHFALGHRKTVVLGGIAVLIVVLPLVRSVGFEFMPSTDEGEVRVYGEVASGTRIEAMDEVFRQVEAKVQETIGPYIENVLTSFGTGAWYHRGSSNTGSVRIKLVDLEERDMSSEKIAELLRRELSAIPGLIVRTRASGGLFMMRMLQPQGESVAIEVRGYDRDEAIRLAGEIERALKNVEGITDTRLSRSRGRPEVTLEIDRDKAGEFGLSVSDIAGRLQTAFGGEVATMYRDAGDEYDLRVRLREEDRVRLDDLRTLWMTTPRGDHVPLSNFVRLERRIGPTVIERMDQERTITVAANLAPEYSLGNVMRDVQRTLSQVSMPQGFTLVYGGEYEDQQKSYKEMLLAFALAIVLVYMVMASQFESLLHPLIIMFSIPFALIGVILTLVLTNTTLNVQSLMGVVMLAGIVVNNAIVLIDYVNLLRRTYGMPLHEAVEEGGRRRLRPILMTTLTTVLALTPMAIGLGEGSELQAPMARVVVGGLLVSTLITLIFVPTVYTILEDRTARRRPAAAPIAQEVSAS